MRTETPQLIRLADYRPPEWLVDRVELDVSLSPRATRVVAKLALRPNPETPAGPLVLDGDGLHLKALRLDGVDVPEANVTVSPEHLTIAQPPRHPFVLEIETLLDPSANTQLMGLYRSNETYCTQCEAEGFRRITYFPDRPDVMAVYTTRIEADRDEVPVLLSNGNLVEEGEIAGTNRHYAIWYDPFPKPSYLFALVGGRLGSVADEFTTASGRNVALRIYVEPGKENRCAYAMEALKRSMRWDEEAFGREYDLDMFMIVAVSDFNMGAMENKGLNVFNDKFVLATEDTATDSDYASIEAIIAHEYFHNWTGNRITCRDWFQLCLKEGLTVFRDQEFTADQRSRAVKRITDVRNLRTHQFMEDAGPLAHPVRPAQYREINNFYTATVYEKGAEVVRMLRTLIGASKFREGMDLYFERHDGDAATIEEFLQCFADASGADLTQFHRWYDQAGTPEVAVTSSYDPVGGTLRIETSQMVPPTPGQADKEPMVIPLVIGALGPDGIEMPLRSFDGRLLDRGLLTIDQPSTSFVFRDIAERPVLSLNRGFAAPINLVANISTDDLLLLARHDSDPFNRWQAVQAIATSWLVETSRQGKPDTSHPLLRGLTAALDAIMADQMLERAFVALALSMPSEADIAREIRRDVDPDAIWASRTALRAALGEALGPQLRERYDGLSYAGPYSPDAASAGRRSLRNACLDLLVTAAPMEQAPLAFAQFESADNMTDRMAALVTLARHDVPEREAALADFYGRFANDPLILDKWFMVQATTPGTKTIGHVRALMQHPAFSLGNPNRVRALIGAFAHGNQTAFHRADGQGYQFIADQVLSLDASNPQVAARLLSSFSSWRSLEPIRRALAHQSLTMVRGAELSRDVRDIVERTLGET